MTETARSLRRRGRAPGSTTSAGTGSHGGRLAELVAQGIRGVTSNPTIFAKAIAGEDDYDEQFRSLVPGPHRRRRPTGSW